jgi:copper(I)-binding protein
MTALRAVLAPAVAAAVTLAALAAWAMTGHAGRPAHVRVDNAWVMTPTAPRTAAYFTVANTGDAPDDLLAVRTPVADTTMLGRQVTHAGAGQMVMVGALTVPAHGVVRMNPFTADVMFRPRGRLPVGRRVPFTLVFRQSGQVHVTAVVVPPGGHG